MKGIILAGGSGQGLFPLSAVSSTCLQAVYDKPLVYYPLTTLVDNGIKDILLIADRHELRHFWELLRESFRWGISVEFMEQARSDCVARTLLAAESFIQDDTIAVIQGDQIFHENAMFDQAFATFKGGAVGFAFPVREPERHCVVEFDEDGRAVSLEEEPKNPRSMYAAPGLFLYGQNLLATVKKLAGIGRGGGFSLTDVNVEYLRRGELKIYRLPRGMVWLAPKLVSGLHAASVFVSGLETTSGVKLGCPEEAALRQGLIYPEDLQLIAERMPPCEYRHYLEHCAAEFRQLHPDIASKCAPLPEPLAEQGSSSSDSRGKTIVQPPPPASMDAWKPPIAKPHR